MRIEALKEIEKDKSRVARANNKKVKNKSFQVWDLVLKTILPLGTKSNKFGKWSPSWEGPLKVIKVVFGNLYMLETLQGDRLPRAINRTYLKNTFQVFGKRLKVLSKQWPIHVSPLLEQICPMYTSPLAAR